MAIRPTSRDVAPWLNTVVVEDLLSERPLLRVDEVGANQPPARRREWISEVSALLRAAQEARSGSRGWPPLVVAAVIPLRERRVRRGPTFRDTAGMLRQMTNTPPCLIAAATMDDILRDTIATPLCFDPLQPGTPAQHLEWFVDDYDVWYQSVIIVW